MRRAGGRSEDTMPPTESLTARLIRLRRHYTARPSPLFCPEYTADGSGWTPPTVRNGPVDQAQLPLRGRTCDLFRPWQRSQW